jgi:hypothetical protein
MSGRGCLALVRFFRLATIEEKQPRLPQIWAKASVKYATKAAVLSARTTRARSLLAFV